MDDEVAVLRRFNRSHTQRIGVLDATYLDSGRALGPARLLYEVGREGARVADLRRLLGLDSGYLSRLLRQLEGDGHVTVSPDPADRRQRLVHLTAAGRDAWDHLERRSQEAAERLVEPLTAPQRAELASALAAAERLLRVATVEVEQVGPRSPAAEVALRSYFEELDRRFRSGLDPVAVGVGEVDAMVPPEGTFLVLRSGTDTVGCGGLQRLDEATAEVKRMWIHPGWRGLGLGGRLLARLEQVARDRGRRRVVLDTNETLVEAVSLYGRAGYEPIERYNDNPYAHHWFAKDL